MIKMALAAATALPQAVCTPPTPPRSLLAASAWGDKWEPNTLTTMPRLGAWV